MINIKEIIWKEENVDIVDYYYYYGMLNGNEVVSIHPKYSKGKIGYRIYMHIDNTAFDRTEYKTLDEAKLVAKNKVEDYVFSLIDMRDYKLDDLL
jgi:hypothetical protein